MSVMTEHPVWAPTPVGPLGAVRRALTGILRLHGRASRSEYWWFMLVLAIVFALAYLLDARLGDGASISVLTWYASLIPTLTLTVRRLHDSGNSGYWIFVAFMPIIGVFWILSLLIEPSDPGDNAFGPGLSEIVRPEAPSDP